MADTMQPLPAPAPSNPTQAPQDVEMADSHAGSPPVQHSFPSSNPPSAPAPSPTVANAPASSQPPPQTYQFPHAASQSPANTPQLTNHAQPVGMAQQMQLPPFQGPNGLHLQTQMNPSNTNHVNGHVPQPPPAQSNLQMHMGTIPMTMTAQPIAGYYSEMPVTSPNSDAFELVSDGGGMLSGGRMSKKDVKRRTKTGCLTCRKRRIKCDERHPVCRNCEKSKRECLGYDPVFRSQPGPSVLQPAPVQASFSVAPPQIPQLTPGPTPGPVHSPPNAPPLISGSPSHSPSLSAASPRPVSSPVEQISQAPSTITNTITAPTTVRSPSAPPAQEAYHHLLMSNAIPECRNLELRPISIDDLLTMSGPLDPIPEGLELSPTRVEECANFFAAYATCADIFLETHWLENNARSYLLTNKNLLAHISNFLDDFKDRKWITNPEVVNIMESREARIIWDTLTLCRAAHAQIANTEGRPEDPELNVTVNRLKVVEALFTGQTLKSNPVPAPDYPGDEPSWVLPSGLSNQLKRREMRFWDAIGQYVVISDDMPDCDVLRDLALIDARVYLDLIESRDVIYSVAVIRQISRFQPRKVKNLPASTDEKDVAAKLYVATKFIEEEKDGKAANQVIRRLCAQLHRWWERPENF